MQAERLKKGGIIGIFCPSHVADMGRYVPVAAAIERLGFKVKFGENIQKQSYRLVQTPRLTRINRR